MTQSKMPSHMRRAKIGKRARLALAMLGAGFAIYRLVAVFLRDGSLWH